MTEKAILKHLFIENAFSRLHRVKIIIDWDISYKATDSIENS
jgi:hypothetical protein